MAPPTGQIRPGRYLWVFTLIVVVLYALVFLTGDHKPSPKLGIDLSGGTTVTLTARTLNGQAPTQQQLSEAVTDIENRVNGLGVSGAQVVSNGSNIVITVPGDQGQEAKDLGQTAKLVFRPVTQEVGAGQPVVPTTTAPSGSAKPSGSATSTSGAPSTSGAKASSTATASTSKAGSTPTAQGLPAPGGSQGIGALDHQAAPIAHQAAAATTTAAPTTAPTATAPT